MTQKSVTRRVSLFRILFLMHLVQSNLKEGGDKRRGYQVGLDLGKQIIDGPSEIRRNVSEQSNNTVYSRTSFRELCFTKQ